MVQLILTEEQVRLMREALGKPVQLCDPTGKVLVRIEPEMNQEFLAELKRRAAQPGPRYTGEQVRRHLQALQEAWDREGGFDEARMRVLLEEIRSKDPS
jgi:hypothetical protein